MNTMKSQEHCSKGKARKYKMQSILKRLTVWLRIPWKKISDRASTRTRWHFAFGAIHICSV